MNSLGLRDSELLAELLPSDLELPDFLAEKAPLLRLVEGSREFDEPLLLIFCISLFSWFFGDPFAPVFLILRTLG